MKWLLLALLVFLLASGRGKLGALIRAARGLPKDFDEGKRRVDAPAEAARDVTPNVNASKDDAPRS